MAYGRKRKKLKLDDLPLTGVAKSTRKRKTTARPAASYRGSRRNRLRDEGMIRYWKIGEGERYGDPIPTRRYHWPGRRKGKHIAKVAREKLSSGVDMMAPA